MPVPAAEEDSRRRQEKIAPVYVMAVDMKSFRHLVLVPCVVKDMARELRLLACWPLMY